MATQSQIRNLNKARDAKAAKSALKAALGEALAEMGLSPQAGGRTVAASAPAVAPKTTKANGNGNGHTNGRMVLTFVRTERVSKGGKLIFEGRDEDNGYLGAIYLDPEDEDRNELTVTIS